jgi:hypothetical protein
MRVMTSVKSVICGCCFRSSDSNLAMTHACSVRLDDEEGRGILLEKSKRNTVARSDNIRNRVHDAQWTRKP